MKSGTFLTVGLATWRLARMAVREAGPWGVFTNLREQSGIEYGEDGYVVSYPDWNPLHCVYCTTVYAAVVVLLMMPRWARLVLAASGMAVLIEEMSALVQGKVKR